MPRWRRRCSRRSPASWWGRSSDRGPSFSSPYATGSRRRQPTRSCGDAPRRFSSTARWNGRSRAGWSGLRASEATLAFEAAELLAALPAFGLLGDEARALVAGSFDLLELPFGTPIVREGDEADAFYVLAE